MCHMQYDAPYNTISSATQHNATQCTILTLATLPRTLARTHVCGHGRHDDGQWGGLTVVVAAAANDTVVFRPVPIYAGIHLHVYTCAFVESYRCMWAA